MALSEYMLRRQGQKNGTREKDPPKPKTALRQVSEKKKKERAEAKAAGGDPDKKALDKWFAVIEAEQKGDCGCWECNKHVPDGFIRCATAHIFPKKGFYSVRTHPLNYLILAASCCHDKSHKVESFKKMKVFREAVDRFLQFEHLLTAEEKAKKYYTLFREAAKESFPQLFN